jgi:hypothetical protein
MSLTHKLEYKGQGRRPFRQRNNRTPVMSKNSVETLTLLRGSRRSAFHQAADDDERRRHLQQASVLAGSIYSPTLGDCALRGNAPS